MENDVPIPDDKPIHLGTPNYPEPAYTAPLPAIPTRDEESEITHLREYWKVIVTRRFSILAIAATILMITVFSTFRETPIYRATVRVQIDRENAKVLSFDNIYELETGDDD